MSSFFKANFIKENPTKGPEMLGPMWDIWS